MNPSDRKGLLSNLTGMLKNEDDGASEVESSEARDEWIQTCRQLMELLMLEEAEEKAATGITEKEEVGLDKDQGAA